MNGKDIFYSLSYVDEDIVQEAEYGQFGKQIQEQEKTPRLKKVSRSLLIAAIIAGMLLLTSCATVVYMVWAESPFTSLPLLSGEDIAYDDIKVTVIGASPTGISLICTIDNPAFACENPDNAENAIDIINGPFYLERKTDNGWEELPKRIKDATWSEQAFRTGGELDLSYSWGTVYGYLEPGTYRLTTTVVEGQPEVQVEFEIEAPKNLSNAEAIQRCNDAVQAVLDRESYHIYLSQQRKFGSVPEGVYLGEEFTDYSEFWKSEDDYLELFSSRVEGKVVDGSMKKDGIKYRLDNEVEGYSNTPIAGWSVWPTLDDERLAWWAQFYNPDNVTFPEGIGVISSDEITFQLAVMENSTKTQTVSYYFDEANNLERIVSVFVDTQTNGFDATVTDTMIIEIKDTDSATISRKIAEQDINFYREFSWKTDQKNLPFLDVEFKNTSPAPITSAPEAIAQAVKECTVDYTKIVVYRDEETGMWKVEFQILYGYQGYQFIYMDDDGCTQMISGAGSKIEEFKTDYPDPK